MEDLRYPVGKFAAPGSIDIAQRSRYVSDLESGPATLRRMIHPLSDAQLDTPYRPGGWSIRQVVHHIADSHVNAYIRFKFALTQDVPTIMPYPEELWAELPEARSGAVELSLDLIEALHRRWIACIRGLPEESFRRRFRHPEAGEMTIDVQLGLYAWHTRHHLAHISGLLARQSW